MSTPMNNSGSWDHIESTINIELPSIYKQVINTYGDHNWNDFLWIINPFSFQNASEYLEFVQNTCEVERILRKSFPENHLFPIYPEKHGLFPWAITDNGDTFFWVTQHSPDKWATVIKAARAPEFEVKFIPCDILVLQICKGTIKSMVLPDDL